MLVFLAKSLNTPKSCCELYLLVQIGSNIKDSVSKKEDFIRRTLLDGV